MNPSQHPAATTSPKLRRSDSRFLSVSIVWIFVVKFGPCVDQISLLTVIAIERKSIWKERMNEYERKGNNLSVSERSMYPTAYTFDRVFSFDSSTRQVYQEGAKNVALSVVGGINGQTSSGKTYTMSGITEYTVADIYDYVEKHNERDYAMKLSAMEIYNESRETIVERLTEETVRDWNHFKELLSVCEAQRQIGETSLNEASSSRIGLFD
ncbi:hypothetical protein G4B88_005008 [Cannabis sativa]|uniref:Kinesin motor domain-containing protein n=1 Tax=Cannabis sativa TaxID=3483 RepID=A0A7J6H6A6_CANSA|nr:hypothetical protein G4B88_005008 [Cannabis sativa]